MKIDKDWIIIAVLFVIIGFLSVQLYKLNTKAEIQIEQIHKQDEDTKRYTAIYYDQTIESLKKTNKDLYKNFKQEKLLPPFDELLDMPLNIYKLQLSLYQMALEHIGMKAVARRIMWLLPDGSYNKIPLESYTKQLEEELIKHPIIL